MQKNQSQGTKSRYGATFSHLQMLYTSLYRLFKAQQIILYEISSIAAVNNELYGRQGKGRIKKRMYQFWHTLFLFVLILVVMEYTQWDKEYLKEFNDMQGLNPCCNGIYSMRSKCSSKHF